MNKDDKITKEIFETLIKYTNLTPDAIDDLYYLQGYIENLQKEIERLNNVIKEVEKYLNKDFAFYEEYKKYVEFGYMLCKKGLLDKLKELKENNK